MKPTLTYHAKVDGDDYKTMKGAAVQEAMAYYGPGHAFTISTFNVDRAPRPLQHRRPAPAANTAPWFMRWMAPGTAKTAAPQEEAPEPTGPLYRAMVTIRVEEVEPPAWTRTALAEDSAAADAGGAPS